VELVLDITIKHGEIGRVAEQVQVDGIGPPEKTMVMGGALHPNE
jgi:hypothetical protein